MAESSSDRNPLDLLAEEFVERYRKGQRPSLTEYAQRSPELADEIRDLFPALVEMEQLKPVTGDQTGKHETIAPPDLDRLGEFRILRRVGYGGMGVVYEALQESLGRHVALKVLPADALADIKRLERFRREAKAAAKLHHTNIVPVFGTGEIEGRHYYAMQFIAGHPLDAVIEEVQRLKGQNSKDGAAPRSIVSQVAAGLVTGTFAGPKSNSSDAVATLTHAESNGTPSPMSYSTASNSSLTVSGNMSDGGRHYWTTVARIGEQVADALSYAHEQGILHRDIKPANLLLDLHGIVWVADFGLAKAHESEDLTIAGDIVGTLRYMAPERFDGSGDHRADTYALGLTLYELLTLKPAFAADNRAKLVEQVTAASPPKPRSINSAIPRDLETIVLKAIQRDPAMRYQSAAEMAEDLRRYQEDRPITARRASTFEQTWRWCRRNPAVAGLLASLMAVFGIGTGVSAFFAVRAERNEAEMRRQAGIAEENARQAAAREQEAIEGREKLRVEQDHSRRLVYDSIIHQANVAFSEERIPHMRQLLEDTRPKPGEPDLRGWEWHYLYRAIQPAPVRELRLEPEVTSDGKFTSSVTIDQNSRYLIQTNSSDAGVWYEFRDSTTFQPVGRLPLTGVIPVPAGGRTPNSGGGARGPRGGLGAINFSRMPVLSADGLWAAMLWAEPVEKQSDEDNTVYRRRIRLWQVATGQEFELPEESRKTRSNRDTVSSLAIGPAGEWVAWVEASIKPPEPSTDGGGFGPRLTGTRTDEPYEVVRWTRATGKLQRWTIQPERGTVNVSIAPDGRSAFVAPNSNGFSTVSANTIRQHECWDLSGDVAKRRWLAILLRERNVGRLSDAVLFSPGLTVAAAVSGSELSLYRLSDGERLWQRTLPFNTSISAVLRSNMIVSPVAVSDDGNRVVFSAAYAMHVCEKTDDDQTTPLRHWVIRQDTLGQASIAGLYRFTADAKSLIAVSNRQFRDRMAAPADQVARTMVVQVTDVSRDPHALKPYPDVKTPVTIDQNRVGNGPATGPTANVEYVIRNSAGREIGRVPPLEQNNATRQRRLRQTVSLVHDGRRLLVSTIPFGPGTTQSFNRDQGLSSWKLYSVDGPGDMQLIASGRGAGTARPSAANAVLALAIAQPGADQMRHLRVIEEITPATREKPEAAQYAISFRSLETGEPIHRIELPASAIVNGSSIYTIPGSDRLLVVSWSAPTASSDGGPIYDADGNLLAFSNPFTVAAPMTVRLYDLPTKQEIWKREAVGQFTSSGPNPFQMLPSPDCRHAYLATTTRAGESRIAVVRLADGALEHTLPISEPESRRAVAGPGGGINSRQMRMQGFAPDGRLAITFNDEVQLWDGRTGQLTQRFQGHTFIGTPSTLAFAPDSSRMFVAGNSKLHVWDLNTGRELMTIANDAPPPTRATTAQRNQVRFIRRFQLAGGKLEAHWPEGIREFDGSPVTP